MLFNLVIEDYKRIKYDCHKQSQGKKKILKYYSHLITKDSRRCAVTLQEQNNEF